jgi:hypothetical protein
VALGPVRAGRRHGEWFAEADVDGEPIWFQCADVELDRSAEAFASAVLLPAARRRRRVRVVDDVVSATWLSNSERIMAVWQQWWKYPVIAPAAAIRTDDAVPVAGTTLCFTGGVDSFYSLLRSRCRPDVLAFVQGYDIPIDDERRMAAWRADFDAVASAAGVRAVCLRSNLRRHPLVAASQWTRAHGGALAAVGHLLAPVAGTLGIASSFPVHYGYTWGSHVDTDHFWSSGRLQVVHQGADRSRVDRLFEIADEPLVHRYLRVCWENRTPTGNCSRCDKCVCTMVTIVACSAPARFKTFDWSISLEQLIGGLRSTRFVRTYGELLERDLPPALASAIRALLRRNVLPARLRSLWESWRG